MEQETSNWKTYRTHLQARVIWRFSQEILHSCICCWEGASTDPSNHSPTPRTPRWRQNGVQNSFRLRCCCVAGKADDGSKRIKLHCQSFGEARQRFLVALCFVYRPWLDILMIESCTSCEMEPLFGRTLWIWILEWIGFCDLFQKM